MRSIVSTLLLIGLPLLAAAEPPAGLATVFVVRHLQKDTDARWDDHGDLQPLSPKGVACAAALGVRLQDEGIAGVYSTERVRTLATGAAVSGLLDGVDLVGDDESAHPSAEFVTRIARRHSGDRAVLVVGHSNTVAEIVLAFRPDAVDCLPELGLAHDGIPDTQYGDIWQVDLKAKDSCQGGVERLAVVGDGSIDCASP